ncbi:MAG: Smr/MutS family protein [Holosporales bacterium]|jgi:DNA-nicking Smr family endonuclease|nr:Smr/MutS family protein [Holosporales bacterium]
MAKINDLSLWDEYKKSVKRLDKNTVVYRSIILIPSKKSENHGIDSEKLIEEFLQKKSSKSVFQIAKLNRLERKKFKAETTIDLHGFNREISTIMKNFCINCIANKVRDVVVITGKGEGIVKQALVEWIMANSTIIIGYFEIKDTSGGIGSFGIRLRK